MADLIPIDGKGEADKSAEAMRALRANLANMIEYRCICAELQRAHYLALVKQGFTEQQAIELCKVL